MVSIVLAVNDFYSIYTDTALPTRVDCYSPSINIPWYSDSSDAEVRCGEVLLSHREAPDNVCICCTTGASDTWKEPDSESF